IYFLVPRLWGAKAMYSDKLINWHFWLGTIGIVIYIVAMWPAGINQGLEWRAFDEKGFLIYSFAETVANLHPYYVMRAFGGLLYVLGAAVMIYNVWMTIASSKKAAA
ncbi:MAG: cbb3-type cytochrome c oxidase subunit I, partial [Sphingomonadales bacterium]|nr:cbb3-type cytochrome c oxidase subunit I [Sphingomonadales bacterium]